MLESVLADVLTRVLGQYLEGIDRDNVHFGAWSGLVELRGVALRPEALAVLFETLGMDLPVTVEAGFIGLLRLQVPWKSIGTSPVQILMEDVTVMARPVRGDGSDDSELEVRERRIKRAKLNTDDAVREASWGVAKNTQESHGWSNWLVSDQLRAKIIDNIQITLKDILLRFEDPFSDPRRPYIVSIVCQSLKAVSANENWQEAFVERPPDAQHTVTRKLLEVKGFRVDWAPITPQDAPGLSRGTGTYESTSTARRFETPEKLKQFMTEGEINSEQPSSRNGHVKSLLHPVDGWLHLRFSARSNSTASSVDSEPPVDIDIRFPHVFVDLDDVQYACLLQTSVYFARLATRGFRPRTAKARWKWAIDQLLPGFNERRARKLRLTEEGIMQARDRKMFYFASRKSLLKARRIGVEEPKQIAERLEKFEDSTAYEEVLALRDYVDLRIEKDGECWEQAHAQPPITTEEHGNGTTLGSFWRMLGYSGGSKNEGASLQSSEPSSVEASSRTPSPMSTENVIYSASEAEQSQENFISLRVAFLLQAANIRLSQNGFPRKSTPRVAFNMNDLRVGVLYSSSGELTIEAVLRSIEAWDILKETRMVYSRLGATYIPARSDLESSYPFDVSEAIDAIRSGSNPAKDLLVNHDDVSEVDDGLSGDQIFEGVEGERLSATFDGDQSGNRESQRHRTPSNSGSRDPTQALSTFRVTENEFLGALHGEPAVQKYVLAFRYNQTLSSDAASSKIVRSKLDVSVATLEAIVDGPKGSFVWGLKFWQPKGMAQDPIMAFLGAAAGARIAELRMELEQALLANTVPMQINAVILAPRFIIPSSAESLPAVVVNMGTLGVSTSDSSPVLDPSIVSQESRRVKYSNYVLTLDDLGVYFSPNLLTAVSQSLEKGTGERAVKDANTGLAEHHYVDTKDVERIIRPFSLRFVVQTLRDSSVVQVAHASSGQSDDKESIAKVRVRGKIPELYLILTQTAMQHMVVETRQWGQQLRSSSHRSKGGYSPHPSGEGWQPVDKEEADMLVALTETSTLTPSQEARKTMSDEDAKPNLTSLAYYDVKMLMQRVTVELRKTNQVRLVAAEASQMQASVLKTGQKTLQAGFTLRTWSVTDASRGNTAAFRRLVYAGTFAESEGVSPPRSLSTTSDDHPQTLLAKDKNFVNIKYTLNLLTNEHNIKFKFLSLNVVCVRETYFHLASFFYKIYGAMRDITSKAARKSSDELYSQVQSSEASISPTTISKSTESNSQGTEPFHSRILLSSEFDGFSFQLVASGGAIALVEMKDCKVQFLRHEDANMEATGTFRHFSVRDWTAPIAEHAAVVTYERQEVPSTCARNPSPVDNEIDITRKDAWILTIPKLESEKYQFRASFKGIRLCLLYRFSYVLQEYFAALFDGVQPVIDVVIDDMADGDMIGFGATQAQVNAPIARAGIAMNLEFSELAIRIPRHSGCPTEALAINTSRISIQNIENINDKQTGMQWRAKFDGVDLAIEYVTPTSEEPTENAIVTSKFLRGSEANMVLRRERRQDNISNETNQLSAFHVQLQMSRDVLIELCEAQYTVLYFVLTENLAETISGSEMLVDSSTVEHLSILQTQRDSSSVHDVEGMIVNAAQQHDAGDLKPGVLKKAPKKGVVHIDVSIPYLTMELSRGWDVTDEACKVLGIYLRNIELGCTYSTPYHLLVEGAGKLLTISDLSRETFKETKNFVVPIASGEAGNLSERPKRLENINISYEKEKGNRASIDISLGGLQIEAAPELLRDLSYLAIPGWPYLESSACAPDVVYAGRTMNIVLNGSQVVLFAEEDESDRRALVLTGEFQLKIDAMPGTGAKTVSLQATQVEVSSSNVFPNHVRSETWDHVESFYAVRLDKAETPLIYPTNAFIEYVAPEVDEVGCRSNVSVDSILCLVSVGDVPLLRSIASRPNRMKATYLSRRNWTQTSGDSSNEKKAELNVKAEQIKKAKENMNLSVNIPAARYLLTDEVDGRFVPLFETRLKSFDVNAHIGNMVQVHTEIAMDLFNTKKGWWEPALESWPLSASVSHGQSGTKAIVLKSEQRLDMNVTPATVTAAVTVARSLRNAAASTRKDKKKGEDAQALQSDILKPERSEDSSSRRPSVAAFLVRNELGIPVYLAAKDSSRRSIIAHNTELEAGVQTEELLSFPADGRETSRDEALRCVLTVPTFSPLELSAARVGKHYVTLFPSSTSSHSKDDLNTQQQPARAMQAVWEVEMANGVPVCVIRSLYQFVNQTQTEVEIHIDRKRIENEAGYTEHVELLPPGKSFTLPIYDTGSAIRIRPMSVSGRGEDTVSKPLFDWSPPLPSFSWLSQNTREEKNVEKSVSNSSRSPLLKGTSSITRCSSTQGGSTDFFFAVTASSHAACRLKESRGSSWVDVFLRAPVVLLNNLPNQLSYRVVQRHSLPEVRKQAAYEMEGVVLAAGVIEPLKETHLHFAGENLKSVFLSMAYDNSTSYSSESNILCDAGRSWNEIPSRFGPEISFEDLQIRKRALVLPSAQRDVDARGQPRRDFRATILSRRGSATHVEIYSGLWVRNRSDTALEVCSRSSYYGASGQQFFLRPRIPFEPPDAFVCVEGPYLSLRLSQGVNPTECNLDQSEWWTSPSVLEDIEKPVSVGIRGVSLEIEVSPAVGITSHTSIVTIRNTSWICNNTKSVLQWCQTSALDSRGNCKTRLVNKINPGDAHGIHWDQRSSSHRAVHLRLAESNGQSDWIWSPAVPQNIGHSRELPAKMYRPKTQEQYIARVASKKISGNSAALVVYAEDRSNPPYRIVNLCRQRAVAFSQAGSHERPWLVRGGKTTRYSWDNPLVPPSERLLTLRILEPEELLTNTREPHTGSSAQTVASHRHERCNLNIDVVGDRVMVLSESYDPPIIVNIIVDGVTKIVTFCEENGSDELPLEVGNRTQVDESVESPVLVVGWDDISQSKESGSSPYEARKTATLVSRSDYPLKSKSPVSKAARKSPSQGVDTDAALFLHSVGISVITAEPSELMYVSFRDVLVNYESDGKLESLALHVGDFQIDNQLERTPYPILLWVAPPRAQYSKRNEKRDENVTNVKAMAAEVHRSITDDDILMIKSFQAAIRPFNLSFEDDFVSTTLSFLSDTVILEAKSSEELLSGPDIDHQIFVHLLPGRGENTGDGAKGTREDSIPASKRIYVHSFIIHKTSLRLTSSGSGSAIAKAAGINSSARALVALILNVENCEFAFPSLAVENVFDSAHHFTILVKEYYISQVNNQRMKLLASNSLMGNPAALFDAVGTGARDFFTEPVRAKGSAEFIAGVGRGSKSLFTHTVGGLVQSVGSIPRAVSSGIEKAVGDKEYLAKRERIRGSNVPGSNRGSSSESPAQGLATGALSFAHGISSGITGLITEPVQGAKQGGAGGLLKGIGRAFIGGVAKPVAGAIDFVSEPAVGLSRQITDSENSFGLRSERFPERPPRAFRDRSQRLDSFDRRYSVGVCLYRAVQIVSGVKYHSELLEWIELSDRIGRSGPDSDLWVWGVVRRFARSMPGTKKEVRVEGKGSGKGRSSLDVRPEKVRVALITLTDVVIATLDCKLVKSIPLWEDCIYNISGQGKDMIIRTALKTGKRTGTQDDTSGFFSGAHSLISAPWDASTAGKRVKPRIGEEHMDNITCGSTEARDDLQRSLGNVLTKIEERSEKQIVNVEGIDRSTSSVELSSVSNWEDEKSMELELTRRKDEKEPRKADLPHERIPERNWPGTDGSSAGNNGRAERHSGGDFERNGASRAQALSTLQKRIERLCSSGTGRVSGRKKLRVVVANRLENGRRLKLMESWLDEGDWRLDPPPQVGAVDAEVLEAELMDKGHGRIRYGIEDVVHEARLEISDLHNNREGDIFIEFGNSEGTSPLSTMHTEATDGFLVDIDERRDDCVVLAVHQVSDDKMSGSEKPGSGSGSRSTIGKKRMEGNERLSDDEKALNQLVEIGFKFEDAIVALAEAGGDMVKAVDILTTQR